jgi:hypothetical protein
MNKVTFILEGTKETAKGSAPSARLTYVDLDTKERMTVAIGNAIRFIMTGLPLYKAYAPVLTLKVGDEIIGYVTRFPGKTTTEIFTAMNAEVLRMVLSSRFTTDELINLKSSTDKVVNGICEAFGHKGKSINIAGAEQNLGAKFQSLKDILKYAKHGGKQLYEEQTPTEVINFIKVDKENRRIASAERKLLKSSN